MSHETMEFDVIIVGGGPAGLSAAIRLMQLNSQLTICILEKGAYIGAHILSGAVIDPRALNELIPDWQQKNAPLTTPVTEDQFLLLTEKKSFRLPTPRPMKNHGNYIISLGKLCRWLAEQAETLGVNIFPEFAAAKILYDDNHQVIGVATGDKGLDKEGNPTAQFQPGIHLLAKQTIFAEGCRGSLTQQLFEKFQLRKNVDPQTYGLGIKELWEIPPSQHRAGLVMHSVGWPLNAKTYGGAFVYHLENNLISLGFVIGLDYENTYLNPYEELQKFKTHPLMRALLKNGKRIGYGARALNEGGLQSIPKLTFPGGVIVGCAAGFLNVPRIKGIHNAMKSGMLAAESIVDSLGHSSREECTTYTQKIKSSWIYRELHQARNIRPAMRWGLWPGLCYAAIDTYLLRGKAPWTFHNIADHTQLRDKTHGVPISYPKHDNIFTFDLLSSVYLTHSVHDENQPCHLKLKDPTIAIKINYEKYASPETRYCPAGVYEIMIDENKTPHFQINTANCIHCKACDIKDPTQNIVWTCPEGGSGPRYEMM